jgi:predicted dehydrogenase
MRIAICGMGIRAIHLAKVFMHEVPDVELVGFYDEGNPDTGWIDELDEYDSLKGMLEKTNPDLLFVTSPNHKHLEHIRTGLEMGVQIFSEKPVVTTIKDTFALGDLLEKYGTDRVIVGLVLRYSKHARDLKAAIEAGQIGSIASIEASEYIAPDHGAFFMRDWRRKDEYSGGFMLEKCCHDLDLYNMATGSRPFRVASFGGRRSFIPENAPADGLDSSVYHEKDSRWSAQKDPFNVDGDIVDHQSTIIEYESGASMTFHTNSNVPDEHRRFCVIGDKGMAEGDFIRGYMRVTDARTGARHQNDQYSQKDGPPGYLGKHYGADHFMVRDIVAHLNHPSKKLPVGVVDAIVAGIVAMAIDESRQTGKIVDLTRYWEKLDAYNFD